MHCSIAVSFCDSVVARQQQGVRQVLTGGFFAAPSRRGGSATPDSVLIGSQGGLRPAIQDQQLKPHMRGDLKRVAA